MRFPKNLGLKLPKSVDTAVAQALARHPAVTSSESLVEASEYDVKEITGELLPSFSIEATGSRRIEPSSTVETSDSASIIGRLSIPIYQQGVVSSRVRQAKQTRTQRRLEADSIRDQVRAAVVSAWPDWKPRAVRFKPTSRRSGQHNWPLKASGRKNSRPAYNARRARCPAGSADRAGQSDPVPRDRVVASFSLAAASGDLTTRKLDLPVQVYTPEVNYKAVRDKWFGLRTPGGN